MNDVSVFQFTQRDIPDRVLTAVCTKNEKGQMVWSAMVLKKDMSGIYSADFTSREVLALLEHKIWEVVSYI